jgi:hypothetical protein
MNVQLDYDKACQGREERIIMLKNYLLFLYHDKVNNILYLTSI